MSDGRSPLPASRQIAGELGSTPSGESPVVVDYVRKGKEILYLLQRFEERMAAEFLRMKR